MEDRYVSPPPRLFRRKFSHSLIYGYRGGPRLSTSRVLLVVRDIFLLRFYIYIYLVGKKIYLVLEDYFKTQTLSIETKTIAIDALLATRKYILEQENLLLVMLPILRNQKKWFEIKINNTILIEDSENNKRNVRNFFPIQYFFEHLGIYKFLIVVIVVSII